VVSGQATTVRRFVRAGLVAVPKPTSAAAGGEAGWGEAAARAALDLLVDEPRRHELSRRGRRVIDGAGGARVAAAIVALLAASARTLTTRDGKARMRR